MKISRIFRKYSRVLLLVFMSILLVVFLIGDVISNATRSQHQADVTVGKAFGQPVLSTDLSRAKDDFDTATRLGFNVPRISGEDSSEANVNHFLLIEEARRAGVVVPTQQIVEALKRNPDVANMMLDRLRSGGRSLESIYEAAARVMAIVQYFRDYQMSASVDASEPELEHLFRDMTEEARVLVSVIDAGAWLDKAPEPTEEEIQAYFEECKARDKAYTEEKREDGYRVGDRVRLQYLTIDPRSIEEQVRISSREVERYFEENKQKYTKEVEGPQFNLDQDAKPQRVPMTFEEAKEQVRQDCRIDKAIKEAQSLMNIIQQKARTPWDTAPLGEDHKRQAPAPEEQLSFEELQKQYSNEYPVTYQQTELLTASALRLLPGFGTASTTVGRRQVTAADYAFYVEGLSDAVIPGDVTPLRMNEPSPIMITPERANRGGRVAASQAFVFCVTEVKSAGPPDSIEDVRDQLVRNLKEQRALKMAEEQAQALAERARQEGLKAAVQNSEELRAMLTLQTEAPPTSAEATDSAPAVKTDERYAKKLDPIEPEQFTRQVNPRIPNLMGGSRLLHERIFATPANGGPDPTQEHKILAVPKADRLCWVVAELEEIKPIYRGDFDAQRDMLEARAMQMQSRYFISSWFDAKNIQARAGYTSEYAKEKEQKAAE